MPVAVNQPQKREDPLDKVLKGLQIANSIFGIRADMSKAEALKAQSAAEAEKASREKTIFQQGQDKVNREKAGQILPGQLPDIAKDFDEVPEGTKGAISQTVVGPEGERKIFLKRKAAERAQADPTVSMERKMRLEAAQKELRDGSKLPAALINTLNDGTVAEQQAASLEGIISEAGDNAFGPFMGRARSLNPYDDTAQTLKSKLKTAKQSIGKFLEGGVLRKEDESKYDAILPAPGDTPEVARQKAANVNQMIQAKKAANMESFKAQGYNIAGFEMPGATQQASEPKTPASATLADIEAAIARKKQQAMK